MTEIFKPAADITLYCRFCHKTVHANLHRSIAGSGKILDKDATFEYICSKCHRSHCFYGKDLIEGKENSTIEQPEVNEFEPRTYRISGHYLIGEEIIHPSYTRIGKVVGKEPGIPNRILVKFGKNIIPLVEDLN